WAKQNRHGTANPAGKPVLLLDPDPAHQRLGALAHPPYPTVFPHPESGPLPSSRERESDAILRLCRKRGRSNPKNPRGGGKPGEQTRFISRRSFPESLGLGERFFPGAEGEARENHPSGADEDPGFGW